MGLLLDNIQCLLLADGRSQSRDCIAIVSPGYFVCSNPQALRKTDAHSLVIVGLYSGIYGFVPERYRSLNKVSQGKETINYK